MEMNVTEIELCPRMLHKYDRQLDRQVDRQVDRQIDRQIDSPVYESIIRSFSFCRTCKTSLQFYVAFQRIIIKM